MSLTLELASDYGYVLLVAATAPFVNLFHSITVSKFRKAAEVKYPNFYASHEQAEKSRAAYQFNCAQRAHGNFLEAQPSFLVSLLIAGLRWPIPSAILGGIWTIARVVYTLGYTQSGPSGRLTGSIAGSVSLLVLAGMATTAGALFAMNK